VIDPDECVIVTPHGLHPAGLRSRPKDRARRLVN
jgi:hypothetical protein